MARKAARTPRLTRREKMLNDRIIAAQQDTPGVVVARAPWIPLKLTAMNQNQKTAIAYLKSGKVVTLLTGSAGTGKSIIAAEHLASLLNTKRITKLYLVRAAVAVGKSIGLLPGEIEDKLAPYFAQTIAHLRKFIKPGDLQCHLEKKVIEMKPVEYLRGMSFDDCAVLIEEAQNLTHEEMEMILTRIGENCQVIFTGDTKQNDLRTESGLKTTVELFSRMLQTQPNYLTDEDLDELDDNFGVVTFTPNDVVRSGLTRAFVKTYYFND